MVVTEVGQPLKCIYLEKFINNNNIPEKKIIKWALTSTVRIRMCSLAKELDLELRRAWCFSPVIFSCMYAGSVEPLFWKDFYHH